MLAKSRQRRPGSPVWDGRCSAVRRFAMMPATTMTLTLCFMGGGGCVAALGAGSVVATDKTPIDHVVSLVTGKDCSIVRQHRGLTYCVEDEITPPVRVHCYPTIGEVSCYGEPDPFPGHQRELGSGPAVATAAR